MIQIAYWLLCVLVIFFLSVFVWRLILHYATASRVVPFDMHHRTHLVCITPGFLSSPELQGRYYDAALVDRSLRLFPHVITRNSGLGAWFRPVMHQAANVLDEIEYILVANPQITSLSMVGISMGGVVNNAASWLLRQRNAPMSWPRVHAANKELFATLGSPHLGVDRDTFIWEVLASLVGAEQLLRELTDRDMLLSLLRNLPTAEIFKQQCLLSAQWDRTVPLASSEMFHHKEAWIRIRFDDKTGGWAKWIPGYAHTFGFQQSFVLRSLMCKIATTQGYKLK